MATSPIDRIKAQAVEAQVIAVLRSTFDPEIPVNVYDLGLVYDINVSPAGAVRCAPSPGRWPPGSARS